MTVKDLIKELLDQDMEADVVMQVETNKEGFDYSISNIRIVTTCDNDVVLSI